jgi:hypothetical protein
VINGLCNTLKRAIFSLYVIYVLRLINILKYAELCWLHFYREAMLPPHSCTLHPWLSVKWSILSFSFGSTRLSICLFCYTSRDNKHKVRSCHLLVCKFHKERVMLHLCRNFFETSKRGIALVMNVKGLYER